jgi:hypothetical protein
MFETLAKQADETKQRGGSINLRRQLQSEIYDGKGPISEYISRILSYRDKLAHTPQKLSKDEIIAHILIGLPKTWSTISTIIENQPPKTQTLDDVVNTLITHERKLATQATQATQAANSTEQSNAHVVRRQKRKNTRQREGRVNKSFRNRDRESDSDFDEDDDEIECWYCLKKGHLEKDCHIKKQANKRRKKRQKQEARASLAMETTAYVSQRAPHISDAVIL